MKKTIVVIVTLSLCFSCIREYESRTNYLFINDTKAKIELVAKRTDSSHSYVIDSSTVIETKAKVEFYYVEDGDNQVSRHPFGYTVPEVNIVFNDSLILHYSHDDINPRNILQIENFEGGNVRTGIFEFSYAFTEEDFNNAVPINE